MTTKVPGEAAAAVPAAGSDPDSQQRLAKTLVAAGVDPDDLPEGMSVEPITDEDRAEAQMVHEEATAAQDARTEAAEKRAEAAEAKEAKAGESRLGASDAPVGRSTTPPKSTT